MQAKSANLVVIGEGAAGLAAALAAAEAERGLAVTVTLLEKAGEDEAGGNTRWTPAYMRMAAVDRVEPTFVHDMLEATKGCGDETYFACLAREAPATVAWIAAHGVEFHQPDYYLAKGPPRIQPVGGGASIHRELKRAAHAAGVSFRYGSAAQTLLSHDGRLTGVRLATGETFPADAVVLACGGFQGDADMMRQHFGPGGESMPLLAPRARHNTGDGIRMALDAGADASGEWSGMHTEPVDPRSRNSAPVMLLYPYGIVVDRSGRRFFDEGGGLVHETWEWFSRHIHFAVEGRQAYAILDRRVLAIPHWQRATRSEVPAVEADTLGALAQAIGVDGAGLAATIAAYNAACTGDPRTFDATRCDGLKGSGGLQPPKSNWARAIAEPPFLAWPLMGAIAYTFGGIATNDKAEVLRRGVPLPGLYAAGEITGHFYRTAPNAVSVLRAFVFGRIAGREAVAYLRAEDRAKQAAQR
jgi:tricarballylate dehydrogenase